MTPPGNPGIWDPYTKNDIEKNACTAIVVVVVVVVPWITWRCHLLDEG